MENPSNSSPLTLSFFDDVVRSGAGYAVTCRLQPNGEEPGGFVSPPTYAKSGIPYNQYQRQEGAETVLCVCLNSIGAEANAMEHALQEAREAGDVALPLPQIVFDPGVEKLEKLTTSQMGHRSCDARLLYSEIDGVPYRESEVGTAILESSHSNMTGVSRYAPLDVLFGMWDSHDHTVSRRVRPALKLARLITAEIHGIGISIRDSGAQLSDVADFASDLPLIKGYGDDLFAELSVKEGKNEAATAGFAQTPAYEENRGGVSMRHGLYESNFSAGLLRGYKFPTDDGQRVPGRDHAARVLFLSLGLLVQTIRLERGFYLRSGCDLVAEDDPKFIFYGRSMKSVLFEGPVSASSALALFEQALQKAKEQGFEWGGETISVLASKNFQKRLRANLEYTSDKAEKKTTKKKAVKKGNG